MVYNNFVMIMKKKIKMKKSGIFVSLILFMIFGIGIYYFSNYKEGKTIIPKSEAKEIVDFENLSLNEVENYAKKKKYEINKSYDYNDSIEKDKIIYGNVEGNILNIVVSEGSIPIETFKEKKVNELGKVPIMMYHGIVDTTTNKYTGGNVDKDGYNRTSSAFKEDLEMYYEKGYRMIRLEDYINGIFDVELGLSPIILTFDDGNENNFKVIKKNEDGTLEFDPNSAIGVLEAFKEKHPDANATATFFVNGGLCNQPKYNEDIIKWLVENGYDVGNHTISHVDFTKIGNEKTKEEVGKLYQKLDNIIPDKYVHIIALPFGSPYKKSHSNYPFIIDGEYNGYKYHTDAGLRVGWEPEVSPFNKDFDTSFLKRVRAYDNNGKEFDIKMTFNLLEKNRFISDGNKKLLTIPKSEESKLKDNDLKLVTY